MRFCIHLSAILYSATCMANSPVLTLGYIPANELPEYGITLNMNEFEFPISVTINAESFEYCEIEEMYVAAINEKDERIFSSYIAKRRNQYNFHLAVEYISNSTVALHCKEGTVESDFDSYILRLGDHANAR